MITFQVGGRVKLIDGTPGVKGRFAVVDDVQFTPDTVGIELEHRPGAAVPGGQHFAVPPDWLALAPRK